MKVIRYVLLSTLLLAAFSAYAQSEKDADKAGDLFATKGFHNPYEDRIAREEGDVLTILINENSASTYTASTNLSKTDSNSVNKIGIPILGGLFSGLNTGATSSNAGTGTTNSTGNLVFQMSVKIKQVLPNGNLVIEGTRWIRVNKEIQSFKLTGTIRPDDVQSDNTVLSSKVDDAHIEVDGKGGIAARQRRGILTKILDWLF